ncbi:MAG: phage head morphogenesis protein [Clostridiales bacterium]|nr:phage head morphogenesis protein [Clostridiales bacterium]
MNSNKYSTVNVIAKIGLLIMVAVFLCTLFPVITPVAIILVALYAIRIIYKCRSIKKEQERPIADPPPKKPVVQYGNGYSAKTNTVPNKYKNTMQSHSKKDSAITKKMFDEFGVQMYKVWETALDGDICPDCAKMQGACVPMDEKFVLDGKEINDPPLCDNCRCVVSYAEEPVPELRRCYEALKFYSEIANSSNQFQGSNLGYFMSLYFLRKLAAASPSELSAAGLKFSGRYDFDAQISNIEANRTKFFNQAIQRAYDYEVKNAASLKTEKGKRNRLLKLKESILDFETLLPANIDYLNHLIPD